MGYAGNMEPSYLIPSCIAKAVPRVSTHSNNSYQNMAISREFHSARPDRYQTFSLTLLSFYVFSKVESIEIWLTTPSSTFSSATRPRKKAGHMSWAICLKVDRYRIGMVSKSSGTSRFTHTCDATRKNIDLYSRSHLWTRQRIESKWPRSCSRHST